jgi:chromosome segregation and condensation protein ScpB
MPVNTESYKERSSSVSTLSAERLRAYRVRTYRTDPDQRLRTKAQAIDYVRERGYVYFWPAKDASFPSLWTAVAGERPVADAHDDPGHVTWGWKDETLGTRVWYYAKVLRRRATFISLETVPYFYALSENYGDPESDYLVQYQEGRLTVETKTVYETLLHEGPLDTVSLRQLARMTSKASNGPFARALEALQVDFKILPIGIAEVGAWNYAFIYEMVHRHYPDLPEQARAIRQAEARRRLAELYFRSVGAAQERDLAKLFGWSKNDLQGALEALAGSGVVARGIQLEGAAGEWCALPELLE